MNYVNTTVKLGVFEQKNVTWLLYLLKESVLILQCEIEGFSIFVATKEAHVKAFSSFSQLCV